VKGAQKAVVAKAEKSVGVEASRHQHHSVAYLRQLSGSMQVQMAEKDPRNVVGGLSAEQTPCLPPVVRGDRGVTELLGTKRAFVMITTVLHVCEPRTGTYHFKSKTYHGQLLSGHDKTIVTAALREERGDPVVKTVSEINPRQSFR
jgi:hypothetical protein